MPGQRRGAAHAVPPQAADADGCGRAGLSAGRLGRAVVLRVLFHPKQLMLVSAGEDAEVRVWDLVDKSCVATLKARPCTLLLPYPCVRVRGLLSWAQRRDLVQSSPSDAASVAAPALC